MMLLIASDHYPQLVSEEALPAVAHVLESGDAPVQVLVLKCLQRALTFCPDRISAARQCQV